jgi:hypothetical protein
MRRLVQVISTDHERGTAYTAIYKEEWLESWGWDARNYEIPLAVAEWILGPLPDGLIEGEPLPMFLFDPCPSPEVKRP